MSNKSLAILLISRLVIAFFIIIFVAVAITQADKETRIFEGKIIATTHDFVSVGLKHVPGEIVTLIGGPNVDLTDFREGDAVIIETNEDRVIRSIAMQS